MKKNTIIKAIIIILVIIAIGAGIYVWYKNFYNPNPSEEEIALGVEEKRKIRNELSNVIKGNSNADENYKIPIEEAREKAIIIFNSLGEKDLNKDNVSVIEIEKNGKKYYYIRSARNNAEVEISTGRMTRINGVVQTIK